MRTQRPNRFAQARGLRPGATLVLVALLVPVAGASAQGDGGSSGSGAGPSPGLLFGAAAVLLLVAAIVGFGLPSLRRRRATIVAGPPAQGQADPGASAAIGGWAAGGDERREARAPRSGASQTETPVPDAGRTPARRSAAHREDAATDDDFFAPGLPSGGAPARRSAAARRFDTTHSGREHAVGYTTFDDRRRVVSPESRYQARRIAAACEARGMVLHKLVGDVQSYSGPDLERPGLNHALEMLGAGEASTLVVAGLDRLSRSAANLGMVIEWLEDMDARLVVLDIDLDTDTEEGRLAARALARVGALERRDRRQGEQPRGVRPARDLEGTRARPAVADLPLLRRRIATMRASGMTLQAIADTLNSEGVPTLRGGAEWRPSSVQATTGYKRPSRHRTDPGGQEDEEDEDRA
jgi:DNA invertase Pin-like site-specific DNA recombinase